MTNIHTRSQLFAILAFCAALLAMAFSFAFLTPSSAYAYSDEARNPFVAIVDTGVSAEVPVAERASVLKDDGLDESGHGSEMARAVLAENPSAQVISVKAFNSIGRANLLMAYAGVLEALTYSPDIIVMSFTAYAPSGDPVMEAVIAKAKSQGVTVVVAAGNQGADASAYSPANSSAAVTVGALDAAGNPLPSSNCGDAVDAWEAASSTSCAAAIHAGKLSLLSAGGGDVRQDAGSYEIVFDANGGTGHMFPVSAGGAIELPECGFSKAGKELAGWNTRADGKGRFVPNRQSIDGTRFAYDYHGLRVEADLADCIEAGMLVLHAQWERPSVVPQSIYEVQYGYGLEVAGTYLFQCVGDGRWLTRDSVANGSNVNTQAYDSTNNRTRQQWYLTIENGGYRFSAANSTGKVMDVTDCSSAMGTNMQMWGWNGSNAQIFWSDPCKAGDGVQAYTDKLAWYTTYIHASSGNPNSYGLMIVDVDMGSHNVQIWEQDHSDRYRHTMYEGLDSHGSKSTNRQWKPVKATFKVKYNGNGETSGSMEDSTHWIDRTQNLTANAYSRTGYYFAGWNTKADGTGTAYADQKEVGNLSTRHGATVNLYAQWKPYKVTVKYHANGGTIEDAPYLNTSNSTYYKLVSSIINKSASKNKDYAEVTKSVSAAATSCNLANVVGTCKVTKAGYHVESAAKYYFVAKSDGTKVYFNADNTDESTTNAVTTKRLNLGTQITANKTVTLKINWVANSYKVAYDGNGATSGEMAASSHTYNTASKLTANAYSRIGYTFAGWNTKANGSGTAYANGASVKTLTTTNNGTVTLYAQWKPITYKVVYELDGGVAGSAYPDTVNYDSSFAVAPPSKEHYRFDGWQIAGMDECDHLIGTETVTGTEFGPTSEQVFKNLRVTGGTVTFTAIWTPATRLLLHVDNPDEVWREVIVESDGQPVDVPDTVTELARKSDCHHLDGTQGLDAWYEDSSYETLYEPRALEPGEYHLYARNWASVSFENGPAAEEGKLYWNDDASGDISLVAGMPSSFEKPFGETAILLDVANRRIKFDDGSRFGATLVAQNGWHAKADCSDDAQSLLTVSHDTVLYKKWLTTIVDGVRTHDG